jgi:hypothetical protein
MLVWHDAVNISYVLFSGSIDSKTLFLILTLYKEETKSMQRVGKSSLHPTKAR